MFDREKFDRDFRLSERVFWFVWWLTIAIVIIVLVGLAFVVFWVNTRFGIP